MWKLRPGALTRHRLGMQCFFSVATVSFLCFHVSWWKYLGTLQLILYFTAYSCISYAFALYHHKENWLTMSPREDLKQKKNWIPTRTAERKTHWPSPQRHTAHIYSVLAPWTQRRRCCLLRSQFEFTRSSRRKWERDFEDCRAKGTPPAARCDPGDTAPLVSSQHTSQACPRLPLKRALHSWISAASAI